MHNQIKKLYALSFFAGLVFYYGIERLYFFSLGYEASIIALLPIASAVVTISLDLPLGYISDKLGRKRTLFFACLSLMFSSLIYYLSSSLIAIVLASSLHALFWVGVSGTFQALIYETLIDLKRTASYNKVLGRVYSFLFSGMGVAILSAGFIADAFGYRTNFFLATLSALTACLISLTLFEPTHKHRPSETWKYHIKEAVIVVKHSRLITILLAIALLFGSVIWVSNEFSQYVFSLQMLELQTVSVLSALALASAAIGRLAAGYVDSYRTILATIMIGLLFGVGVSEPPLMYVCLIGYFGIAHCLLNSIESAIQHRLPNHLRATTMSLYSTLLSTGILIFAPLSSWLLKSHSVNDIFILASMASAVILSVLYLRLKTITQKEASF